MHKKSNLDEDVDTLQEPEPENIFRSGANANPPPPPANDVTFYNVEQIVVAHTSEGGDVSPSNVNNALLLRNGSEATNDSGAVNSGQHHKKKSGQSGPSKGGDAAPSNSNVNNDNALRNNDAANDSGAMNMGKHHKKESGQQYGQTRPSPPPSPSPTPAVIFTSLRDVHQSSNNDDRGGNGGNAAAHAKYSQEKDATNPEENLPGNFDDSWRVTPSPTVPPTPAAAVTPDPTVDLRRVNPAPDVDEGGGGGEGAQQGGEDGPCGECRAVDGAYFGEDCQSSSLRNEGVTLRYQYELVQDLSDDGDGMDDLTDDILPNLEEGITNALIPVFFKECMGGASAEGGRLLLQGQQHGARDEDQYKYNNIRLRHRRLSLVVGIDAQPPDFPLSQQACTLKFINTDPFQITQCHRVEGALKLHFPPTSALTSALLSSTTLATLRVIERGMNDDFLRSSHPSIRKLRFLGTSYELQPEWSDEWSPKAESGPDVLNEGTPEGGTNFWLDIWNNHFGLILGIIIPLIVVGCCCCIGFVLRKRRRGDPDDQSSVHSESIMESKRRAHDEASRRPSEERGQHLPTTNSFQYRNAAGHSSGRGDDFSYGDGTHVSTEDEHSSINESSRSVESFASQSRASKRRAHDEERRRPSEERGQHQSTTNSFQYNNAASHSNGRGDGFSYGDGTHMSTEDEHSSNNESSCFDESFASQSRAEDSASGDGSSASYDEGLDDTGHNSYEEEQEDMNASSYSVNNPLEQVFEKTAKERAKRKKAKKQRRGSSSCSEE